MVDGISFSGCSTSGGTITRGDTVSTAVDLDVSDDRIDRLEIDHVVDGIVFDSHVRGPDTAIEVESRYSFDLWPQIDWSGTPADGTKTAPVELVVDVRRKTGFDEFEWMGPTRISCGSVELFNEDETRSDLSVVDSSFPSSLSPSDSVSWSVTIANDGVEDDSVSVSFKTLNKPSGSSSGTVPAGGERTFSGSGPFNTDDLDDGNIQASVSVEGQYDSTSTALGTINVESSSTDDSDPATVDDLSIEDCGVTDSPRVVEGFDFEMGVTISNPTETAVDTTIEWSVGGELFTESVSVDPGSTGFFTGVNTEELQPGSNDVSVDLS